MGHNRTASGQPQRKRSPTLLSLLALLVSLSVVSGNAHANSTVGAWSLGPIWDISPINMLLLPTGKVMFYPGDTIHGDDPRLWDPVTNTLTSLPKAGYDIFCTGHSFMKDGTILFTGGNLLTPFNGLPNASVYNPFTNIWTPIQDMNAARWYPSTTTLANGDVLVMTGMIDSTQLENPLPQIWQPGSGTWRNLTNAMLKIYNYSWVYATPSGKAFVAGPEPTTRYLNTSGSGSWSTLATFNFPNYRDYGSSVMYGPNNILIAGGGQPPTNTAEIIDLSNPTPTWQYTNPMAFPRRHMNMTLLPDDNVLVTGGTSADGFNNPSQPVYAAEMWNINTRTWTTLASQSVGRFYHSNALLLPDGRVLSAGGINGVTYDYTLQAEIYSPPYLFKGPRPTITSAPTHARYGETFFVGTPDATNILKARLIRLSAVTHAFDMNQRLITVSFTQAGGGLNITTPSSGNFAPPGHYMLFILNSNNVPSVAKIIQIDDDPTIPTLPAAPTGLAATAGSSTAINLTWTDQSTNETSFKIERALGAGAFSQVGTVGANVTTYADSGLTAGTSYSYRVRASNTGGDSAYSNTATVTTHSTAPSLTVNGNSTPITVAPGAGVTVGAQNGPGNPSDWVGLYLSGTADLQYLAYAYLPSGATSATLPFTMPSTAGAYQFRFFANDGWTLLATSPTVTVASSSSPAAPSGLAATAASSTAINLNWADQSTNETSFKIERALGAGAFSQVGTVGANVTTYSDTGLTANTSYSYRVRASNSVGDSAYSNTASATTPAVATAPAAPSGVAATAVSSSAINLNWADQSNNETGFKIERALGAGAFSPLTTVGANVTIYADSGLTANTSYSYRVRATNSVGDSAYSNTANATTPTAATVPAKPSGLVATAVSQTQINLTWVDQSNNEDGFKIERRIAGGTFAQIATVGANVTTYADTGLIRDTRYTYRVRAYNSVGNSGYSNNDNAKTAN